MALLYRELDSAAAELTLAKPKSTNITLGRQHIEAIIAEPEIIRISDFRSLTDSSMLTKSVLTVIKSFLFYGIAIWF